MDETDVGSDHTHLLTLAKGYFTEQQQPGIAVGHEAVLRRDHRAVLHVANAAEDMRTRTFASIRKVARTCR